MDNHGLVKNIVFATDQWSAIAAVLGFGSRYLRVRPNAALAYLTEAVFPCYLAHQTILVIAVHLIAPHALPAPLEAAILIVVTLGGSLGVYEAVRRVPLLRPFWGLRYRPRIPSRNPTVTDDPRGEVSEAEAA